MEYEDIYNQHIIFANMGGVYQVRWTLYLQGNCISRPALGVEVERSIDVGSHMFTHRDVVLCFKFH